MLRLLKYYTVGTILFIITIVILDLNVNEELVGPLSGLCLFVIIKLLYKRWSFVRTAERVERSLSEASNYVDSDKHERREQFRPWTEENLIWSGKRKLTIEYIDAKGDYTERKVIIHGIWPNEDGELFFRAYCELRQDWRTFNGNRVQHVTDSRNNKYTDFNRYMTSISKF